MLKTEVMTTAEAFKACNLSMDTAIDRVGFSLDTLTRSVNDYMNAYPRSKENLEFCLFITPRDLSIITTEPVFADLYDPVSRREILEKGYLARLLNIDIYLLDPVKDEFLEKTKLLARRELSHSDLLDRVKMLLNNRVGSTMQKPNMGESVQETMRSLINSMQEIDKRQRDKHATAETIEQEQTFFEAEDEFAEEIVKENERLQKNGNIVTELYTRVTPRIQCVVANNKSEAVVMANTLELVQNLLDAEIPITVVNNEMDRLIESVNQQIKEKY